MLSQCSKNRPVIRLSLDVLVHVLVLKLSFSRLALLGASGRLLRGSLFALLWSLRRVLCVRRSAGGLVGHRDIVLGRETRVTLGTKTWSVTCHAGWRGGELTQRP
jgi:hypothetical protein